MSNWLTVSIIILSSLLEFGIFVILSSITNAAAEDEQLAMVKILYLSLGNLDLLEMYEPIVDASNKVRTFILFHLLCAIS